MSDVVETTQQEALVSEDPLDNPAVNKAARDFERASIKAKALARNLGGKGLARVFIAANEFPFAEAYPKFRSDVEQELFILTLHIQGLKGIMSQALDKHKKEIESLAVNGIVEELKQEKMEEVNGKME